MYKEIAMAYANGHKIQWRYSPDEPWVNYTDLPPRTVPMAGANLQWRVLNDVHMTYRVGVIKPGGVECLACATCEYDERRIEADPTFIKWITERVLVVLPGEERE